MPNSGNSVIASGFQIGISGLLIFQVLLHFSKWSLKDTRIFSELLTFSHFSAEKNPMIQYHEENVYG